MIRFVTVFLLCGCLRTVSAADKPNIVIVLSDDMGYSDIGCYGGEIETPALNRLAANGLRFTQFYNTARCCPTRASLLTGLYPHQAGVGHMMENRGHDGYRGDLNRNCVTIAEVLRPAGYRTYMTGKWHVTKVLEPRTDAEKHNWPLQRGFDRFYGTIIGGGSFWDPSFLTRDNRSVSAFADPEYRPDEPFYYTDAISDHAVRYVRDHQAQHPDQPFFLYVAYTAAHWPMHAREQDIAKYRGKYSAGYQAIREQRYRRMIQQGVISREATTVTSVPAGLDGTKHWDWDQRNMEVFAAMVDRMDQGLGRLIETLKSTGQLDNTLICYLQDNGGCAEGMGRGKEGEPRPANATLPAMKPETLQTALVPKQTRDGYPVRQGKGVMAGGADTYIGYGEAWAAVSNTPFREYKHWVHEGGIATPLIVHWPAGIQPDQRGGLRHEPGHLIDLMATCVDVAKAIYPRAIAGATIKPMRGVSLRPAFAAKPLDRKEPLFWEHEGNRAVRDGRWKLVAKENQPWELYDIDADRSEQRDLAKDHPERLQNLAAQWDAYAAASDVLPLGTWKAKAVKNEPLPKRNVLFVMADDFRPELACYGSVAITPHLNRLAERSLRFNRAYCQQAVCNPSRSSMLTGSRPDTLRLWNNGTHFRERNPEVTTLPLWFKQHGYQSRCVGKIFHNWHTKVQGDPTSWSGPEFLHYANHGDDKPLVPDPLPVNVATPSPRQYTNVPLFECRDVPDEAYYDGRVAVEAVRILSELKDKPFFLAVGFWKPHAPFNAPKRYWDLYERANLPTLNPARPSGVPEIALHDGRELRGVPPNQVTFTDAQAAEIRHGYFANISYLDAQLGKVLDAIDQSGLAERTTIVFVGDHGYHLGEHSLWGKTSTFEYDARVPLMIATPEKLSAGKTTEALVELVDLFPTLVDVCGLPIPAGLDGTSLAPVLLDPQKSVKPSAMSQHPRPSYYDREPSKTPQAMGYSVRTERYRYTEWRLWKSGETMARELYDHQADPAELTNLAEHPAHRAAVTASAVALEQHRPLVKPGWVPPQ